MLQNTTKKSDVSERPSRSLTSDFLVVFCNMFLPGNASTRRA